MGLFGSLHNEISLWDPCFLLSLNGTPPILNLVNDPGGEFFFFLLCSVATFRVLLKFKVECTLVVL